MPGYCRTHHLLLRATPCIYPTLSSAEVHADGGKEEPADELAEALDVDEAAECDDAAEVEPGPDDDACGAIRLCHHVPTSSCGTCHGSALGDADAEEWQGYTVRDWEADRGQVQGTEARQMCLDLGGSLHLQVQWKACRLDACIACDVATHTEHVVNAEPFGNCSEMREVRCAACLGRRCELSGAVRQGSEGEETGGFRVELLCPQWKHRFWPPHGTDDGREETKIRAMEWSRERGKEGWSGYGVVGWNVWANVDQAAFSSRHLRHPSYKHGCLPFLTDTLSILF